MGKGVFQGFMIMWESRCFLLVLHDDVGNARICRYKACTYKPVSLCGNAVFQQINKRLGNYGKFIAFPKIFAEYIWLFVDFSPLYFGISSKLYIFVG